MDHMNPDRHLGEAQAPSDHTPLGAAAAPRKKQPALVAAAAALFLLIVAIASVAVYTFVLDAPAEPVELATPEPAAQAPVAAQAATTAEEPPPVPLSRVFTFRDIFDPLIEPAEEGADDGSAPTTPAPTGDDGADESAITLQDVISVNGAPAAVLIFRGEPYTLAVGESIPGTPWRVLSISEQSVDLQYGDDVVTLGIGTVYTPPVK